MNSLKILSASVAMLCFSTVASIGQTSVTTTPVGVINVTIPAAPSASQPSLTALSVPLYPTAAFQGAVQSIDGAAQVTLAGATWTANQFAPSGTPANVTHIARVKVAAQAANVGKFFAVTANTTNQLTVDLTGTGVANLATVLAATTDSIEVLPVNTIGSVFGTATKPPVLKAGSTSTDADNVLLWNGTGWDTYFWTGTIGTPNNVWKRSGNTDRSGTPIYPDDGVFVVHRDTATSPVISLLGTVPSTTEQTVLVNQTFLPNRFPTDTTLGGLGLHALPGWVSGATSNSADNVLILNASGGWDTYFYTGSIGTPVNIWKRTGNTDRSSTPIPAGTAVFVTHGGANLNLTQAVPYTP